MKNRIWSTTILVFLISSFLILPAYSQEQKQFQVNTEIEFPESLPLGKTIDFKIHVTNKGPYSWVKNLEPAFEIIPTRAQQYVEIKTEENFSQYTVWKGHINTLQGTINISEDSPFDAIFLSVSFDGTIRFDEEVTSVDPDSTVSLKVGELQQDITDEPIFHEGRVEWISRCYMIGSDITARVIDSDMNSDPQRIEEVNITVWSDNDDREVTYVATETGMDTGVFDAEVFLTTTDSSPGKRIRATEDSTIHVKYVDYTFPDSYKVMDVIDTFVMSGLDILEKDSRGIPTKITYDSCALVLLEKNQEKFNELDVFYPAPLKQIQFGLYADEIMCKESLALVTNNDNSPACVKPDSIPKLVERGWAIANNENESFEVITPESKSATFYAQPQITSVILKQDSTIRVHLFSYIKEPDGWDMVFDRIFDEVPNNFKMGIIENTPENLYDFVLSGKENIPSGIKAELLQEDGYFVVYLTSHKSLEPGKYDLSIVSVDKQGAVIQKSLFVTAVNPDTASIQENTVKLQFSKGSWGVNLENISESEYWVIEDARSPWPPSNILNITQDNIHPDVKEMIDAMWSDDAKYVPSERDKTILLVESSQDLNADPQEIRDWLETTYVQQFKRNLDDSFSSYIKYDDKIYSFGFVIAD